MINTHALKKKVIELAIQGKLTEQLPEDGNADTLYGQIQEEKNRLIKEGKIKKEKALTEISELEIPFELPQNWKWVRFGDISINYDSKRKPITKRDRKNSIGKYEYFGATGAIDRIDDYIFDGQYLMIGEDGGNFSSEKDNSFIADGKFWANNHVHVVQTIIVDIWYLKHFLDSCNFVKMGLVIGVTIPKLNQKNMNSIVVPMPPLAEQKRIANMLDEVLTQIGIIENLQQQYESDCEVLKGKIIDAGICGKLTKQLLEDGDAEELYAQIQEEKEKLIKEGKIKKEKPLPEIADDEIPFEIPKNWKWVRLIDCGITQTGNTPSKTHPEYFGDDLPFIGPGDIMNGRISFGRQGLSDVGKSFGRVCNKGSIMQVCIGGSIGKCAITDRQTAFNQQINTLTPLSCVSKYLYYVLCSGYFSGFIDRFSAGMATPIINKSSWESLIVPLPPLREQVKIADLLDEILFTLAE